MGRAFEEDTFQKVEEPTRKCDEDAHAGTPHTSVKEVIAQEEEIEQLKRMFEALSARVKQFLS